MPLPYGLLPHELIEIIDNERIIPGITRQYKLSEDFPLLNYYNPEKEEDNLQRLHQRCLLFMPTTASRKSQKPKKNLKTMI